MRIDSFVPGLFFILKILSLPYEFRLFILPARQPSSDLFHLPVCSFFCLKILTTIFSSKGHVYKPSFELSNGTRNVYPSQT